MKIIRNKRTERVIDELGPTLSTGGSLDVATSSVSLFAYAALKDELEYLVSARLVVAKDGLSSSALLGSDADRAARNQLRSPKLAADFSKWLSAKAEMRSSPVHLHQAMLSARDAQGTPVKAIAGGCSLTTDGIGVSPGSQFSLVQSTEGAEEAKMMAGWFEQVWDSLPSDPGAKEKLLAELREIDARREPYLAYLLILHHLFGNSSAAIDEDKVVKSATGIRETAVWKKLFKFQRDGVIGAIDKLEKFGGCIIADSVGLGKTFEALARRARWAGWSPG